MKTPPTNLPTVDGQHDQHVSPTFDNLTTRYGFQWCPGCGNFAILNTIKFALVDQDLDPSRVVCVSDIGQAGKLPMWLNVHGFHGLHGRALPFAQGVKVANPALTVLCVSGDGGAYGEGTGHFVHACRRNVNLTYLVHDNATYALTTGQASPTTLAGTKTPTTPAGQLEPELNPLQVAIASGATFVARAWAGDQAHFQSVLVAAMQHPGFAVIDVLQPCVVWNRVQTWQSWQARVRRLPASYDSSDRTRAFAAAASQWAQRIDVGIFYREERPMFDQQVAERLSASAARPDITSVDVEPLLQDIMGKEQHDLAG
ncbi:MAG: thiamine pyrophosphate-dependent enzyme [Candidatus Andersenbacteria bacterium]